MGEGEGSVPIKPKPKIAREPPREAWGKEKAVYRLNPD